MTKKNPALHDTTNSNGNNNVNENQNETKNIRELEETSGLSGLSPVTKLSGVLELQHIMAGSAPDATPPSQNILGSPPKRDMARNPVRSKLARLGEPPTDTAEDQNGLTIPVSIPSSRRQR